MWHVVEYVVSTSVGLYACVCVYMAFEGFVSAIPTEKFVVEHRLPYFNLDTTSVIFVHYYV